MSATLATQTASQVLPQTMRVWIWSVTLLALGVAAYELAQVLAWQWALANQANNGSLPSGKDIGREPGRHARWGRLVKRAGLAGELDTQT